MADIVGLSLQLDPNQANQSVGSFRQQLKLATEDLLKMNAEFGSTSNEAIAAAKNVAQLRDQMQKANELTAAFNPDRKFQALSSSVQTVTGGFSALTGAMALLGVQSDDVQKTLLKVQAALAISEGVNSVLQAGDAFKNLGAVIKSTTIFRKLDTVATNLASGAMKLFGVSVAETSIAFNVLKAAIIATGIGILIVALGALYTAFENAKQGADDATEAQKKFADSTEGAAKAGLEAGLKFIQQQEDLEVARAKVAGKSEEEIANIQKKWEAEKLKSRQRYYDDVGFLDKDAAGAVTQQAVENQVNEYNRQTEQNNKLAALDKQRTEKEKAENAKRIADQKALNDELYKIHLQTQILSQEGIITSQQIQDDADAQAKEAKDKQQQEDNERFQQQQQNIAGVKASLLDYVKAQKEAADEQMFIDEAVHEAKQKFMSDTINLIGLLADAIGKQTIAGKVLGIAQATINTFIGATEVLRAKTVLPEPIGTIAKLVNVAAVIATGLAAVKNIVKTPVPGGGGGSVSVPSISTAAPLQAQKPVLQTSTSLDQSSINAVGNAAAPVRAYVLDADVQNNRERDTRLNRAARLG